MSFGIVLTSLTSCEKKKDWTCKCYVDGDYLSEAPIQDQKKKDAESACNALESNGIISGLDCKLD